MSYRAYLVRGDFDKLFQFGRNISMLVSTVRLEKLLDLEVNGDNASDLCDELDWIFDCANFRNMLSTVVL